MTELKKLWHTVFGDAPSIIDAYFDTFYSPELTAAEFADGELAAAAYVMPAGELVYGRRREKCAHIYAVAVYPKFRGRGLGIAVTNRAVEKAKAAGYSAVILHPAEESLFGYYEKNCGFETCFYGNFTEIVLPEGCADKSCADIESYIACRERFLQDIPHVALSADILSFFVKCGGKLYASEAGCAAVEIIDGTAYFREMLGDALLGITDASDAFGSSPGTCAPVGMIHGKAPFSDGWMGLSLE